MRGRADGEFCAHCASEFYVDEGLCVPCQDRTTDQVVELLLYPLALFGLLACGVWVLQDATLYAVVDAVVLVQEVRRTSHLV